MTRLSAATRPTDVFLHASCVEYAGDVFLLLGKPGSGKSHKVISYLQQGGTLVADDYLRLELDGDRIYVSPAAGLKGMIENRKSGIARVPFIERARISALVLLGGYDKSTLPEWILNCANIHISNNVAG